MRKPLPSAVVKNAAPEIQADLFALLQSGKTLAEGVEWLEKTHALKSSITSLSDWRSWYALKRDVRSWNDEAADIMQALRERGDLPADLIERAGEAVFLSRSMREGDAKAFVAVSAVIQRDRESRFEQWKGREEVGIKKAARKADEKKILLAERRISALERKAAALEAAANRAKDALKGGGALDDAARAALIEEMDALILGKKKTKA